MHNARTMSQETVTEDCGATRVVSVRLELEDYERLCRYMKHYEEDGVTMAYILRYCILEGLSDLEEGME